MNRVLAGNSIKSHAVNVKEQNNGYYYIYTKKSRGFSNWPMVNDHYLKKNYPKIFKSVTNNYDFKKRAKNFQIFCKFRNLSKTFVKLSKKGTTAQKYNEFY